MLLRIVVASPELIDVVPFPFLRTLARQTFVIYSKCNNKARNLASCLDSNLVTLGITALAEASATATATATEVRFPPRFVFAQPSELDSELSASHLPERIIASHVPNCFDSPFCLDVSYSFLFSDFRGNAANCPCTYLIVPW